MLAEYKLTVVGKCPVDNYSDVYTVIVRSSRTIMVEEIIVLMKSITSKPITQEDLTIAISTALKCQVETLGVHSGVETRVTEGST